MLAQWSVLSVTVIAIAIFLYGVSKTAMPVVGVLAGPLLAAVLQAPPQPAWQFSRRRKEIW